MKNEPKENNSMSYVLVLLSLIIIVLIISFGFSALSFKSSTAPIKSPAVSSAYSITITASGTVANSSSAALLNVFINGSGQTNQLAVENLSTTLSAFNSTILRYVNDNTSRISTSYFNSYKLYNKSGYEASENIAVTIPNISNVSKVIGALSSIPSIYVTGTTSQLSDSQISSMRTKALSAALANATTQAGALIGNGTIYTTNITVNSFYVYPYSYALGAGSAAVPGITTTVPPQFYGGQSTVTESITVVFIYSKNA